MPTIRSGKIAEYSVTATTTPADIIPAGINGPYVIQNQGLYSVRVRPDADAIADAGMVIAAGCTLSAEFGRVRISVVRDSTAAANCPVVAWAAGL